MGIVHTRTTASRNTGITVVAPNAWFIICEVIVIVISVGICVGIWLNPRIYVRIRIWIWNRIVEIFRVRNWTNFSVFRQNSNSCPRNRWPKIIVQCVCNRAFGVIFLWKLFPIVDFPHNFPRRNIGGKKMMKSGHITRTNLGWSFIEVAKINIFLNNTHSRVKLVCQPDEKWIIAARERRHYLGLSCKVLVSVCLCVCVWMLISILNKN